MTRARTVMVQGTASSVGKSLLVTGLCRLFASRGYRVAPFKSQNMALNSYVTADGGEIGRAQAVQAEACGVPASVTMNPVLLKPESDRRSQVVVMGKPIGSLGAVDYHDYKPALRRIIADCLAELRAAYDLVVIEGAGSPAEINLKDRDIVNMAVAEAADAPVLLVGDIDRGGVFAALVGTMELLEPHERQRVAGFIINKFRGDVSLLGSGLDFLRERTGVPVLGVVPHLRDLRIAEEDSVSLDRRRGRARARSGELDIAVIRLPRISNYDDLEPLEHEPGVAVRFVTEPRELRGADLLIVPGSKSTIADLAWLRARGLADELERAAGSGTPVIGVCGGCQMLGQAIFDPDGVESDAATATGLGLLPLTTRFSQTKRTAQVRARQHSAAFWGRSGGQELLTGYEIHMGAVTAADPGAAFCRVVERNRAAESALDGAVNTTGTVVGTMIHGIFENSLLRRDLLNALRARRGLPQPSVAREIPSKDSQYDRLAAALDEHLDSDQLRRIIGL
jgi:adenosylcobyric acid synthase